MALPTNGHAHAPAQTVVLKLLSVPDKGAITVRFLGAMKSTLTHYIREKPKGRSEACLGENCPAAFHRLRQTWKGYVPAEVWREAEEDWYPGVVEITEALGQQFDGRQLLGEVWELQRCRTVFKHPEVVGVYIQVDRPAPVDTRTWVDTVCFRLYHTTEIIWGAHDPLPNRVRLETRKAPPPRKIPTPEPEKPANPTGPRKTMKELEAERIRKATSLQENLSPTTSASASIQK